jgi:hypothetical protein
VLVNICSLYDKTYDSAVDHAVPGALSKINCSSVLNPSATRASNDSMPLDRRLEEVINRYDAQTPGPQDEIQEGSPNVFWNEKISSIADGVTRMPTVDDPPLWRVRVRVSLSLIQLLFGGEHVGNEGRNRRRKLLPSQRAPSGVALSGSRSVSATGRSKVDLCGIGLLGVCGGTVCQSVDVPSPTPGFFDTCGGTFDMAQVATSGATDNSS